MSEPFVGEIRIFAGNFAPRGWALCDGQLLAVSSNDALFSLLGTIYGGDGRTTFALPDLRGRVPVHLGSGPGLTPRPIGSRGGAEQVTLNAVQTAHGHAMVASANAADVSQAGGSVPANTGGPNSYHDTQTPATATGMTTGAAGGGSAHTNLMPYQCVNFIIALVGIYPSRN